MKRFICCSIFNLFNKFKDYYLILLLPLFINSCEKNSIQDRENHTYQIVVNAEGESSRYDCTFVVSANVASLYNARFEIIKSPYCLTQDDLASGSSTFYSEFSGIRSSNFVFGGTAYRFLDDHETYDTLKVRIQGYYNNSLIVDTIHLFRSFYKKDAAELHDSIEKCNNFQINIVDFNSKLK